MASFSEGLIRGVFILSLALFLFSLFLIVLAIGRRIRREGEFRVVDDFRFRLGRIFDALHDGTLEYAQALAQVRAMLSPRFTLVLEQLLLERLSVAEDTALVRQMAEDLGLVEAWRQRVRPPGARSSAGRASFPLPRFLFFARARDAENLGRVRDGGSWRLLAEALEDPNADVQRVALRSLAAIGEPQSFPVLLEYARHAFTQPHPRLSERELAAALARFPLEVSGHLLPLLCDPAPKLRLLAADVLIEMLATKAQAEGCSALDDCDAGRELTEAVVAALPSEENPDVRARSATLLGYARCERSGGCLRRLLNDEAWFVRLRAVRALGGRKNARDAALLSGRLTDTHWQVREAAARALARSGDAGVDELLKALLTTADVYAREQVIEELETSGELERIALRCADGGAQQDVEVLNEIGRIGKKGKIEIARHAASALPAWHHP